MRGENCEIFCFCDKVHELAGCQKPDCGIHIFVRTLDNYLKDSTKTVKERKDFFISHCCNFAPAFKFMFTLSKNKPYTSSLLKDFKKLIDDAQKLAENHRKET